MILWPFTICTAYDWHWLADLGWFHSMKIQTPFHQTHSWHILRGFLMVISPCATHDLAIQNRALPATSKDLRAAKCRFHLFTNGLTIPRNWVTHLTGFYSSPDQDLSGTSKSITPPYSSHPLNRKRTQNGPNSVEIPNLVSNGVFDVRGKGVLVNISYRMVPPSCKLVYKPLTSPWTIVISDINHTYVTY